MKITIDENAGFCWGVVRTVEIAEETLQNKENGEDVYILGQIIHNPRESERLEKKGLKIITHDDLPRLADKKPKVLIRAHGEPPSTYEKAKNLGIEVIDATCPLVVALQKRVKNYYMENWQIVVFGKKDHAEIIGLRGFCNDECIVISNLDEALDKIDFGRKTVLFSQTTMDKPTFYAIKELLESRIKEFADAGHLTNEFVARDTICKYVSGREDNLRNFAAGNDIMIFVAGRNSSNGKSLFHVCQSANAKTYFIEDVSEIDYGWFNGYQTVGITGATSTPQWYLKLVKDEIEKIVS